jgi:hypothetical protein
LTALADKLRQSLTPARMELAEQYVQAFKQFAKVVESCFGQVLMPGYAPHIDQFMTTYRSLKISIPMKVHLLESHAQEFLKMKGEEHGLGFYSEQWGSEKVDVKHPNHGNNLLTTTVIINGKHL